ncbi:MAG: SDR family oxidoreductase [Azospirillaceae bacterium]|nr:SDR family oxidoreductase [Azospirillaceae bacterium]
MTGSPGALFCFGLGYSARVLAIALRDQGWHVAGTCRDPVRAARGHDQGIEIHCFTADQPLAQVRTVLAGFDHLLISVPPDEHGDPVLRAHEADLVAQPWRWAGYLSTTGVYGDRGGGWVDETATLMPSGRRGRQRVDAEAAWLRLGQTPGLPVHLFRLAGIYGPGRSALDSVRAGSARRVDKPGQVFSRIHVDDIAAVLQASIARPNPGAIYNVCDDTPSAPAEVIAYACGLLGREPPPLIPFADAALSPMARSFYDDNKRVDNTRIKTELGVRLRHVDYRSGLQAQLTAEQG